MSDAPSSSTPPSDPDSLFVPLTLSPLTLSPAASAETDEEWDVVVVGAGLAGFAAAYDLAKFGLRVAILEASSRIGGRTQTVLSRDGNHVDLGGQWVFPQSQHHITALLTELGIKTYPQFCAGKKRMELKDGSMSEHASTIPSLPFHSLLDLHNVISKVDALAKEIYVDNPYSSEKALEYDAMTFADLLNKHTWTDAVRQTVGIAAQTVLGAEMEEVSALYFLWYVKAAGGVTKLIEVEGGAQQDRIVGGTGAIFDRLLPKLEQLGVRIFLESPVMAISQPNPNVERVPRVPRTPTQQSPSNNNVVVEKEKPRGVSRPVSLASLSLAESPSPASDPTRAGRTPTISGPVRLDLDNKPIAEITTRQKDGEQKVFRAKRVVLALSPKFVEPIEFSPPLPEVRLQLMRRGNVGSYIKCIIFYASPFWRKSGYSGQMICYGGNPWKQPVNLAYDACGHEIGQNWEDPWQAGDDHEKYGRQYALVAFICGAFAIYWSEKDPQVRKNAVLEHLARHFGAEAKKATDFLEKDWTKEKYTKGCPVHSLPPGALTLASKIAPRAQSYVLREQYGVFHFASTETATEWVGYMDGAVQSGKRAAKEIIMRLSSSPSSSWSTLPSPRELSPSSSPSSSQSWSSSP